MWGFLSLPALPGAGWPRLLGKHDNDSMIQVEGPLGESASIGISRKVGGVLHVARASSAERQTPWDMGAGRTGSMQNC